MHACVIVGVVSGGRGNSNRTKSLHGNDDDNDDGGYGWGQCCVLRQGCVGDV